MKNLHYKRVRSAQIASYFDISDRQARRKMEEMLEAIGKQRNDPLYFYEFCECTKRPPEEVAAIFRWDE